MTTANQTDELRDALNRAAELVADLPEELRSVAFTEAFRVLYGKQTDGADEVVDVQVKQDTATPRSDRDNASFPDEVLVKDRGSRTVKVLYAVANITGRGDDATPAEIDRFLRENLATVIRGNKIPTVVNAATPKYLRREKVGRTYSYRVTGQGEQLLIDFSHPD